MRKCNAVVSGLIMILFLIHAVAGIFQLMGFMPGGSKILMVLAFIMTGLILLHISFGIVFTIRTLSASRKAGAFYRKENRLFWTRRISGFTLMILIVYHVLVFYTPAGDIFRLHDFGVPEFTGQILLVLVLLVHVLSNIRPALIAFGVAGFRIYMKDLLFVLAVVLALCAAAFLVYYLRWNVLWKYG